MTQLESCCPGAFGSKSIPAAGAVPLVLMNLLLRTMKPSTLITEIP
jgi:hypothetical protein